MAALTLRRPDLYPDGTVVGCYPRASMHGQGGAPNAAAVTTATASGGAVTFSGLTQGAEYVAWAQVGGRDVYLTFSPPVLQLASIGLTVLGEGDDVNIFTPDPSVQSLYIKAGTAGEPDATYSPLLRLSRTLSIPESAFSGDGAPGLASVYGVTRALSSSEGQAVGVYGGGVTDGSHVGAHSDADAVGGYFVGRSSSVSTRSGIGIFANGRRENENGFTTGAEIVSDNETLVNGKHEPTGASKTKGIWLHAVGTASSGTGLQFGFTGRSFEVGVGFNSGSTSAADIRTDSQAGFALRVRGTHAEAGISVKQGSGVVLLGSSTEVAVEPGAILETPFLRINATGMHFAGLTPIATPVVNKGSSTDVLNTALKAVGIIAGT